MENLTVLVVQDKADREFWEEFVEKYFNKPLMEYQTESGHTFLKIIHNRSESLRVVEGLRITDLYYTPEVLQKGLNERLYDTLVSHFVRSSVNMTEALKFFDPKVSY